jgi:fructose-1,6-bisphosphatase II / sedoheptulose-1,7-bisphosphatase
VRSLLGYGFDLLRATQEAAVAAGELVGGGDKEAADQAAVDAMRQRLNRIDGFRGLVVIGEGEKDNAPMLHNGELVGGNRLGYSSSEPAFDIAVDPLDGTTQAARMGPEAMSVIAVGHSNSLFPAPAFYMRKLAIGRGLHPAPPPSLTVSIPDLVSQAKTWLGKDTITVCLLDRPRHTEYVRSFRECGCRVKLIADCDVSAAISTAIPSHNIDLYYGIGGAPEGVITAAAMKCLGGHFEGQLVDPKGASLDYPVMGIEDLAKGEVLVCATGVTNGSLLRGVRPATDLAIGGGVRCHSVLLHSAGRVAHWVTSELARP